MTDFAKKEVQVENKINQAIESQRLSKYIDKFYVDREHSSKLYLGRNEEEVSKQQQLLEYFVDNVIYGEADLKVFSFQTFKEQCDLEEETNPPDENAGQPLYVRLQMGFIDKLPKEEVQELLSITPKGARIKVYESQFLDGSSPSSHNLWTKITQESGLWTANESSFLPSSIDIDSIEKMSEVDRRKAMKEDFSHADNGEFLVESDGYIEAEPMQGYAGGGNLRLVDSDTGERKIITMSDVQGFVVVDVDIDLSRRREREIYPGRFIQIWRGSRWVKGEIADQPFTGVLRIRLTNLVKETNIFGEVVEINKIDLDIGAPPDRDLNNPLPELGTSSFELNPHLHREIDMTGNSLENPYVNIPKQFRPGKMIRFKNGLIGMVKRASEQGMSFVKIEVIRQSETIPWQFTELEDMPEVLVGVDDNEEFLAQKLKGKVIQLKNNGNFTYKRVLGLFSIDGQEKIMLETLPVFSGNKANLDVNYFTLHSFKMFMEEAGKARGSIKIPRESATTKIKELFPDEWSELVEKMNSEGKVVCRIIFNNGDVSRKSIVYLHTLPWGIWVSKDHTPRLIKLGEIKSIDQIQDEFEF